MFAFSYQNEKRDFPSFSGILPGIGKSFAPAVQICKARLSTAKT
jgi:hypothetical protein